ncbi:MAG: transporter substrate-binding domain-containing protein [Rhizobacter sp.]|nr:transporter substrate-binding domain-containing protein [Bacteriovorax sp.]
MKLLLLLAILYFSSLHATTITIRTDLWCPYACDPKSERPGFMVEVAKEIFLKKGYTVDYNIMNWARAIGDVKNGTYDGLLGCNKADAEGFVIPEIPTGVTTSYYYTLKNNAWTYKDKNSLKGVKIGIINDYSYGDEIDKLVKEKNSSLKIVSGEEPLNRLIQMTENKRLDGFVENPLVLAYTLKKMKKEESMFKVSSKDVANDPDLFIAFSPANPKSKEYAKILDEGMIELRKSGRLKEILLKYGLNDWKVK